MKELNFNGWRITDNTYGFYACNGTHTIFFKAEYKNGLYFNIVSYVDVQKKRTYTNQRYHYKLLPLVREMTVELLKNGWIWDYQNQTVGLNTYKKDIEPYYRKCKKLGLEVADWLENLFEE
jgi:hypothetical protein